MSDYSGVKLYFLFLVYHYRLAMRNINDRREAAATRIQRLQRHRQHQRQLREQQLNEGTLQDVDPSEGGHPQSAVGHF